MSYLRVFSLAVLLVLGACSKTPETPEEGAQGQALAAQAASGKVSAVAVPRADGKPINLGKNYSAAWSPGQVGMNEEAVVVLQLDPASGQHWNGEDYPEGFPFKLEVAPADGLSIEPTVVKAGEPAFNFSEQQITVQYKVKALKAGEHIVTFKGSLSTCDDKSCQIMRDEKFTLGLIAK